MLVAGTAADVVLVLEEEGVLVLVDDVAVTLGAALEPDELVVVG